ncbi:MULTISPECIES: pseudouridine synthase [Cupriavidus]
MTDDTSPKRKTLGIKTAPAGNTRKSATRPVRVSDLNRQRVRAVVDGIKQAQERAGGARKKPEDGAQRPARGQRPGEGQDRPRRFGSEGDDRQRRFGPRDGDDRPRRFGPGEGQDRPRRFGGEGDDRQRRFGPRDGDDRPRRFSPGEGQDRPRRFGGEGDDRQRRFGPRDGDDRPRRFGPGEGQDRPRRFGGEGDDRQRRFGPRDGDDRPRRFSPGEGQDRPRRFGGEGDDRQRRFGPRDGDDRPRRSGPGESQDRPRRPHDGGQRDYRGGRPERAQHAAERPARAERPAPAPQAPRAEDGADGLVRLSKRMSELGLCSRREADEWIPRGWVLVDGQPVTELGSRIRPDANIEIHQAARSEQGERVTVLLHKPVGYVSGQAEDGYEPAAVLFAPENQWEQDPTHKRFAPWQRKSLAPAGRLDIDSTGLLVLTQDGRVARHLIGEDSTVEKEYLVRVQWESPQGLVERDISKVFPAESIEKLRHGLSLDGEALKPAKVSWQNEEQLRFVLREGKKRQIRRMCEQVGLKVVGLKRVRMGRIVLGDLPVGQWRFLGQFEKF